MFYSNQHSNQTRSGYIQRLQRFATALGLICTLLFCNISHANLTQNLSLAETLKEQGKLPQALNVLHQERQKLAIKSQEHTLVMGLIANVHILQRRYDEAFLVLSETQPLAEQRGWTLIAADQASYLANLFQRQQNHDKARRWYEKALSLSGQTKDNNLQLQTQINLARLMLKSQQTSEVLAVLNVVTSQLNNNSSTLLADTVLNGAQLLMDYIPFAQQNTSGADPASLKETIFNSLTRILAIEEQLSQRVISQSYGLLAELYQVENRYQEAISLLENAIFSGQQYPDLLYKWEWESGIAHKRLGNIKQAYTAMERAVKNVEAIRQDIPVDYVDGRSSFRQTLEPLYLDLTDLLLQRASNSSDATTRQGYLRQARGTMELLKRSELEDYFDNRCVIENQQEIDLGQISSSTAAIYPIMFPDRLELLVSFAERIEQRTVPLTSEQLSSAATELASRFRSLDPAWQHFSEQFYNWLVSPIEDLLVANQIDTLIYLPDGALRLVPIASLYDGQQFLIQQYSVVTSPGLTLFDTTQTAKDDLNILMAGLSAPGPVVDDVSERLYAAIDVATDTNLQKNLSRRLAWPRERREESSATEEQETDFDDAAKSTRRYQTGESAEHTFGQLRIVAKRTPEGLAVELPDDLRLIRPRPGMTAQRPGYKQAQIDLKRRLRIVNKIALSPDYQQRNSDSPLRIIAKHDSQQAMLLARARRSDKSESTLVKPLRIVAKTLVQNSQEIAQVQTPPPTLIASNQSGPLRIARRSLPKDEGLLRMVKENRIKRLKQRLKLPGVDEEIANISALYDGNALLNQNFSKAGFIDELLHNRYDVIHIASHGVFGDSAENSFVMTHDELLDMNQLEVLLSNEKFEKAPVELITLSACQTADGDDRAPLGISGIALRAKVRSALGALWAVSDAATVDLMSEFYINLQKPGVTKAQALREAQISLLQQDKYRHPFFWSAFILIGNWL